MTNGRNNRISPKILVPEDISRRRYKLGRALLTTDDDNGTARDSESRSTRPLITTLPQDQTYLCPSTNERSDAWPTAGGSRA